ncbi:thioesterase-like superfamily-domain-containing protein [Calycina marina]|uniref:Thioesterase-like superfamily-domain-containing protein n=1 Tax=Calycina marina TaxID=1763456 RepID=A0A9P7YZ85_9HELO|nr:thioesterase-like superfamily-domain-containing protein [Calycina marina]
MKTLLRPLPQFLSSSTKVSICKRCLSSTPRILSTPPPTPKLNSRWLSTTKSRLGKCILWGLSRPQAARASEVSKILGEEWRVLVAGSEGFLSGEGRAGLLRQKVVWGEMDSMGHVNNVTYIRYAESARVQWAHNFARVHDRAHKREWEDCVTSRGMGMILKSIRTDYKFPMTWPDHITVLHKLASLPKPGDHSFQLDVLVLSELYQRASARCFEDIVTYDYKKGRKTAVPDWMLKAFERTWNEQIREKERAGERLREVDRLMTALEKDTWDGEGAVEDMGVAT